MHGRVFGIKHISGSASTATAEEGASGAAAAPHVEVQASFGGLLCRLRGEQAHLEALEMDMM